MSLAPRAKGGNGRLPEKADRTPDKNRTAGALRNCAPPARVMHQGRKESGRGVPQAGRQRAWRSDTVGGQRGVSVARQAGPGRVRHIR